MIKIIDDDGFLIAVDFRSRDVHGIEWFCCLYFKTDEMDEPNEMLLSKNEFNHLTEELLKLRLLQE